MKIVMSRGLFIVIALTAVLVLLAEPLTQLFYHDPAAPVYSYTVMGLRLLPLCMPLALWSLVYVAYAQAVEKRIISVVLPIMDGLVGVVSCSLILIPLMKMNGLYLSNILNGVICFFVILVGAWIERKRFPHKSMQMDEYGKNIGIRLVYGIAEDVKYQNLLGLNVLTIRV